MPAGGKVGTLNFKPRQIPSLGPEEFRKIIDEVS